MGYLEEWGLTPEDDNFHPANDDPWWTETFWLAWFVPERKLCGYIYPMFRVNAGVQAGGVMVFDDSGEREEQMRVFDYDWHRPIPDGLDMRNMSLGGGLTLKVLEPAKRFEIEYANRDMKLHLDVEGIMRPLVTLGTPPFNKGHIDQICHVTGWMVLDGDEMSIDCLSMRDRSWGPRQDGRQPTVGYDYSASDPENAFCAVSVCSAEQAYKPSPVYDVTTGFLVRDGVWSHVVSGHREAERNERGLVEVVTVSATDELGRTVEARGETVCHFVAKPYPSMLAMQGLLKWEFDGHQGWGEQQDCWHPRRWRKRMSGQRS
jgi:hypothetical protein